MKDLDRRLSDIMERYCRSGIEEQVDYDKFYLYSIITHSTAIEGSTITEIENQLLFDQGIVAKNKSMVEQMMNLDLKEAYLFGFDRIKSLQSYSVDFLCKLSAMVMRRTGSVYSTLGGNFDSSKGELRLCNVSAGIGGSSYMAFNKVAGATENFCLWLNKELSEIDRNDIVSCYRLSFEAHFRLVSIHPWVDGNGRIARLLMNMVQRQLALVPSIVTSQSKADYIQALVDAREKNDSSIFQDFMLEHHILNLENRLLQFQKSIGDTVNGTLSDTVNDTVNQEDFSSRLLALIKAHPDYTYNQYAILLNVSRATVARHIKSLSGRVICRKGSDKKGFWEIINS